MSKHYDARNFGSMTFDPKRKLSPHFRLAEFTRSATAKKHQLYNIPREESELANLRALADQILEPARVLIGVPLTITSGYRCATLNRLIGGAVQSQHMVGEAADFIPKGQGPTGNGADVEEAALLLAAQPDLPFDQLIFEVRERLDAVPLRWIHISHKRLGRNRREVLSVYASAKGRQTLRGVQSPSAFLEGGTFLDMAV
jgi:zinc D-Ala-D-Ala carboxypeptidase